MSHVLADRVLEASTSAGAGPFALAGAVLGFRAFTEVCAVTDTVPYYIEAVDMDGRPTGDYEYGLGTYSAANQLTRTTVRGSSNGGLAVSFPAGNKLVGLGIPAPNSIPTRQEWRTALGFTAIGDGVATATDSAAAAVALGFADGQLAAPGDISFRAVSSPRTGWLKANGAAVSRTTYAALFAAIGTTFGAGNGSTTFNLPDLRGEFLRGWDDARGVDPGRGFGTAQLDQMQRIMGEGNANWATQGASGTGAFSGTGTVTGTRNSPGVATGNNVIFDSAGSAGARTSTSTSGETRPRNVALLACIKF